MLGRISPCIFLIIATTAGAVPATLGDLDEDGEPTVQDMALLAGHITGARPLSATLQPFADLTKDGVINSDDQQALIQLIVQSRTPEALPPASVRFTSPADGEGDVAVTRETIVHFTLPLALAATLDTTKFYAEFGGRKILSRVELSSDRKKATLFYLEPLPSSARLQVKLDGTGLTDLLGRPVALGTQSSADGVFQFSFDTISITPVAATAIKGRVFASKPATTANGQPVDTPLAGVTITVDGAEQELRAVTDAAGNFTLSPCPAGSFFVHVDGRTSPASSWPNGDYYPTVGKRWEALAGRTDNLSGNSEDPARGTIYLPCVCAGTLQTVSQTQDTRIAFPAAVLAEYPILAGTELTVPANSLFADDGTRGGKVGIAPVPPTRLPSPLPPGLSLPMVITVQSDGATNFDRPVPVCLPNIPDSVTGQSLPPGAKSALWSFNHDLGSWEIAGAMTVSEDGRFVKTDAGVGVRQPGWHGTQPGTQVRGSEPQEPKDPNCWPGAKTAKAGFSALADCAMEFGQVNRWLKCGLSVAKAASSVDDYWNAERPTNALGHVKNYSSRLGLLSSGLSVLKDCGFAATATASPFSKLSAALTCGGGALDTLNTYLGEASEECSNAGFRKAVAGASSLIGLVTAGRGLKDAIRDYDPNDVANLLIHDKATIDAAKAAIDAVVTAVEIAQPNNPNATLTPEQAQVVANAVGNAEVASERAEQRGNDMEALRQNLDETRVTIREGSQGAGDSMREAGRPSTLTPTPPDVRVTFPSDEPGQPPLVIHPRPGPGGVVTFIGPPDRGYCMETYNRITRRYERFCGFTGPNGGQTAIPPVDAVPTAPTPLPDADNDGLPDAAEGILGTNPNNPDSDGDRIADGAEVQQGTDPMDGFVVRTGVIASAPATGHTVDVCAVNNIAVTANGGSGISIFNVLSGLNPVRLAEVDTPGTAMSVACSGNLIAVADYTTELVIVEISQRGDTRIVRNVDVGSPVTCVTAVGPMACAGTASGQVAAVDMVTGSELWKLSLESAGSVQDVAVVGEVLYAYHAARVDAIPLSAAPAVSGSATITGSGVGAGRRRLRLSAGQGLLYASHTAGWNVLDIATNPRQPARIETITNGQFGFKQIVPTGSGLAVAAASPNSTSDGPHDLDVYEVGSNGRGSAFGGTHITPGIAESVSVYNGLAYVADGTSGLQVVNYRSFDDKQQAPTITLSSNFNLAAGTAEEGAPMRLTATVTDDVQVRNVEFYVDGALVLTDGNFPFEHRFVTPAIAPQKTAFTVRARATDTGGNATWTPEITLTLAPDATPPQVLAFFPENNALTGALSDAAVTFTEAMNSASLTGGLTLTSAGTDGVMGNADDQPVTGSVTFAVETRTAYLHFDPALQPGLYRLRAAAPSSDAAGNAMNEAAAATFRVFSFQDTDADGVPDDWENVLGYNPTRADSNNNGIPDGQEDFDNDGMRNAGEFLVGTDPRQRDTNRNGINDGLEDTDLDGLADGQEIIRGTDHRNIDTDGDGWDDAGEIAEGASPLNPDSQPPWKPVSSTASFLNAIPGVGAPDTELVLVSRPASYLNSVPGAEEPNAELLIASPVASYQNQP